MGRDIIDEVANAFCSFSLFVVVVMSKYLYSVRADVPAHETPMSYQVALVFSNAFHKTPNHQGTSLPCREVIIR